MFDFTAQEAYLLCSTDAAVRRRAALAALHAAAAAGKNVFVTDPGGKISGVASAAAAHLAAAETTESNVDAGGDAAVGTEAEAPILAAQEGITAVTFWDVYAARGLALRTTASELGPYLMAMLLELNDAQSDLLQVLFQIADDNGLLLIDTKDLRALINEVTENPEAYEKTYGKVNGAGASAILKAITLLEGRGGKDFLYEPAIDVRDFVGKGEHVAARIHILDAQDLSADEGLYRVMLLYLLSECAENAENEDLSSLVLIVDDAGIVLGAKDKTFAGKMRSVLSRLTEREISVIFLAENETDVSEEIRKRLVCAPAEDAAEGTEDTKAIPLARRKEILAADPLAEKYKVPFERDSAYEFLLRRGLKPEQAEAVTAGTAGTASEAGAAGAAADTQTDAAGAIGTESEAEATSEDAAAGAAAGAAGTAAEKDAAAGTSADAAADSENSAKKTDSAETSEKAAKLAKRAKSSAQSLGTTVAGTVGRKIGKSIGENFGSFGSTLGANVGASIGRGIMKTFFGE